MITINILNFNYFKDIPKYHTTFHLCEDDYKDVIMEDIIEVHFVELPKFRKANVTAAKKLEQWLKFLEGEELGELANINERIAEAERVLNNLNLTDQEKRIMELREKKIMDEISMKTSALEEGREEGRKLGEKEAKFEIAKNLLKLGVPINDIRFATGLTKEEIEKL